MNQPNENFLGGRTLLALVLTAGIVFGWQSYLNSKYGSHGHSAAATVPLQTANKQTPLAQQTQQAAPSEVATTAGTPSETNASTAVQRDETWTPYEDENWKFEVSNIGMRVRNIVLKTFKDREMNQIILGQPGYELFESRIGQASDPLYFQVRQTKPNEFVGEANVGGGKITKTISIDSAHYSLKSNISVSGDPSAVRSIAIEIPEHIIEAKSGGFLRPSPDKQSLFVSHEGSTSRDVISPEKGLEDKKFATTEVISTGALYFATAVVDQSDVRPEALVHYESGNRRLSAELVYPRLDRKDNFNIQYVAFAGPKSTELLKEVDPRLTDVVNFGMFGLIARGMLWLMKFFYSFVGNYGVAIIFLTLIVRVIVLPFNVMSFRSMKAMSALNPRMQEIRKKYASDPTRMNMEIASLFKENKVTPLGGCLPMLLQLPMFFALSGVLGNSIELYQAPFMLWIQDLSLKDPYFILPVLMGISTFVQQKLTPNTMDPQQAKVMQFMPLIFSGMMATLPSGLTLYIFINTLFGIAQQKVLLAENNVNKKSVMVKV